jgi:hypothetical protein
MAAVAKPAIRIASGGACARRRRQFLEQIPVDFRHSLRA